MVGRLIAFPLRIGVRGAQLWFRAAEEIAGRATVGTLRVASLFTRNGDQRSSPAMSRPRPPRRPVQRRPVADPRMRAIPTEPPPPKPVSAEDAAARIDRTPEVPEPAAPAPQPHVSEEPALVREEAEPGAEEGAGPGLTIHEPWEGYARMSAKQVIVRLADATPAELAAVSLYESGNRSRQTVLQAVQRQLRTANSGGSPE
jgi:hypothetical protein